VKPFKTWVSVDFQKRAGSFWGGDWLGARKGWIPCKPRLAGAVACLMNFTELKTIDDQVRLSVTDPGSMKKRRFIEIYS